MKLACRLCKQPADLRDSHVFPEFVYRPSYDGTHTAVLLDMQAGVKGRREKGFTESMLCDACENRFSKWEDYFARIWLHRTNNIRPASLVAGQLITVAGLDYAPFKLFHMSVLWRAGVSNRREFDAVTLGTREQALRLALLASDPGRPDEFPFFGVGLRDPKTGGWQDALIHAPVAARMNGQWVFTMIFGGVRWHYFTSAHKARRGIEPTLDHAGELPLLIEDWSDDPYMRSSAPKVRGLRSPKQ